jgi:YggT family protein
VSPFWHLIYYLLQVFFFLLIARLVLDYVQMFARSWRPSGVILVLAEIIYTITDPPLKALRRVIPPLRIGGIALDLSFLVVIILVQILAYLALDLARRS